MNDGTDPITPEETLYRRIAPAFIRPGDPFPSPMAFTPNRNDVDGLSIYRAKYTHDMTEIALNDRQPPYYVGVLNARDLMQLGIEILPSPDPQHGKPGHAHLPALTYADRKEARVVHLINLLATRLCQVHGPFPGIISKPNL